MFLLLIIQTLVFMFCSDEFTLDVKTGLVMIKILYDHNFIVHAFDHGVLYAPVEGLIE